MARSKYKVERESVAMRENIATLARKRREQGCIVGLCTVHCEVDHREEQVSS